MQRWTKHLLTVFLVVKMLATILMLVFPLFNEYFFPFGVVSPYFVMAMAFGEVNKWIIIALLVWSLASVLGFVYSLISLFLSRFCKKLGTLFPKIILVIFFVGETVSFLISFMIGLSELGLFYSAGKIAGILFNFAFVVMMISLLKLQGSTGKGRKTNY